MRFESENPIFESDNLKQQIKIERTKKKGEKLASCSLDYISFFIEEIASFSEGSSFSIIHHIWSASISK